MAPLLIRIQQKNPGLIVDDPVDFIAEGIDIAIRVGWVLQDSSYRAAKLGVFKTWVVAPPSWASSAPSIKTPADLLGRPFIADPMLKRRAQWEFGSEDHIRTPHIFDLTMFTNTNMAIRAAIESGGGFTILPDFAVGSRRESGSLIRLLDKWSLPSGDIQAIMPAASPKAPSRRCCFHPHRL